MENDGAHDFYFEKGLAEKHRRAPTAGTGILLMRSRGGMAWAWLGKEKEMVVRPRKRMGRGSCYAVLGPSFSPPSLFCRPQYY